MLLAYILDAMITQPMSILHSSTNDAASPALELLQLDDSSDAVMVPATNSAKSSLSTSQGTGPHQVADCTQPTGCAPTCAQDGLTCGTCVSLTSQLLADRGATENLYCQHALQGVLPRLRRAVDMNDGSCSSCYTHVT